MSDEARAAIKQAYDIGNAAYEQYGEDCIATDVPDFIELRNSGHVKAGRLLRAFNDGMDAAAGVS